MKPVTLRRPLSRHGGRRLEISLASHLGRRLLKLTSPEKELTRYARYACPWMEAVRRRPGGRVDAARARLGRRPGGDDEAVQAAPGERDGGREIPLRGRGAGGGHGAPRPRGG